MDMQKQKTHRGRNTPLFVACIVGAASLCIVFAGILVGGGGQVGGLTQAFSSGQFRLFAFVGAGSVLGVALLSGVLVRVGFPRKFGRQDGTAIIEFAQIGRAHV